MCYSIPGQVIELKQNIAIIDYFGEKRNALNENFNIKIGDYVYVQGGLLINKISKEKAIEILDFWKDKFSELKKVDNNFAKVNKIKSSYELLKILQKVNLKRGLEKRDLIKLLNLKNKNELRLLYETSNNIRQKEHGNSSCVHGIIEFSNYCRNNCFYCGIRKDRRLKRYRMNVNEIISIAKNATNLGFKALVLQSGEDYFYDEEKLIKIIKEIRKLNVLIFLSIGIRSKKLYKNLYKAGARGILLRFETSNKNTFKKLRPDTSFEERLELIKYVKKLGYILATGFLVGLPEETDKDIINNILLTKSLNPDMYSFGPLIPTDNTPLENQKKVDKDKMLKIIALSRLLDKDSNILVTTALETLDKDAKKEGLLAGANSLMINVTPKKYKKHYTLYSGRPDKDKEITNNIKETLDLLYSLGRAPTDLGVINE